MVKIFGIICLGLMLLFSDSCFAEEGKPDLQLVRTLMQKSGLSKQVEQFSKMFQAGIVEANKKADEEMSQDELDRLKRIAAEAFNAKILNDTIERHIQENLSDRDIRSVLAWVISPLGERISKLEGEAATPAAYQEIRKMAEEPLRKSARIELFEELDTALHATDVGVDITINMQVAFILAVTAGLPSEQRPSVEAILNAASKHRTDLRRKAEQETLAGFLYTYRSLTDAEVRRYIKFSVSESGKKYHDVSAAGLNMALMQAALALGSKITQDLDKEGNDSI